ncbi:hypothetical protein LJC47_00465 [Desulfosarcina sp. OttesenSCG-928-B08]|nr:hypothetical protein [Desulfosarcina sp. OttesenSCG-928-B08]
MSEILPEKADLLEKLREGGFSVPEFIYLPARIFATEDFRELEAFLEKHRASFKVIARSAHPQERYFRGGTFDSLETYADVAGICYARNKMLNLARTSKRLSILRQQRFAHAPELDLDQMGVVVMPFINGTSVMAKLLAGQWEFGYSRDRISKVQTEPYITRTPHNRRLVHLSADIQAYLGFQCEIEYIIDAEGDIYVVQAKDISQIDTLEEKTESTRDIVLDGIRRIRKRRNYRERPLYVMNNHAFYVDVISLCEVALEQMESGSADISRIVDPILERIREYEASMENFALSHQRYAILRLSVQDPVELFQIASHYLEDFPEQQKQVSRVLHNNLYQIDIFISEADTLIARDQFHLNLCSHDAYGIDTVRNPVWTAYWHADRHEEMVRAFRQAGFKTDDTVGISIDADDKPTVHRL